MASSSPFLERVRTAIRVRHDSIRTEQAYLQWVRRFIVFHDRNQARDLFAEPGRGSDQEGFRSEPAIPVSNALSMAARIFGIWFFRIDQLSVERATIDSRRPVKFCS